MLNSSYDNVDIGVTTLMAKLEIKFDVFKVPHNKGKLKRNPK